MTTDSHQKPALDPIAAFFCAILGVLIALLICVALEGCSPRVVTQVVETEKVVYRDSTVYRDSIIRYQIPLEKDQAIVHIGDTSHRETSLAISDAWVGGDGLLYHSIENKHGTLYLPVVIPRRTIWVEATQNRAEIVTREVEVEKPLSAWQRLKIGAFWWLFAGFAVSLAWIFRKPITKIVKRWV